MAHWTLESLSHSLASASCLLQALWSHILLTSSAGGRLKATTAPGSPLAALQVWRDEQDWSLKSSGYRRGPWQQTSRFLREQCGAAQKTGGRVGSDAAHEDQQRAGYSDI